MNLLGVGSGIRGGRRSGGRGRQCTLLFQVCVKRRRERTVAGMFILLALLSLLTRKYIA